MPGSTSVRRAHRNSSCSYFANKVHGLGFSWSIDLGSLQNIGFQIVCTDVWSAPDCKSAERHGVAGRRVYAVWGCWLAPRLRVSRLRLRADEMMLHIREICSDGTVVHRELLFVA